MAYKKQFLFIINLLLGSFLLWYGWVFLLKNYDVVNPNGDLGEFINNSFRTLNGDKPYKDFWLLFPPAEVLFPALLYKIFGVSINVILVLRTVVVFLMAITGFSMAQLIFRNTTAALTIALLLIFCGNPDVYFLPQLLIGLLLIQYFKGYKWGWLLVAGIVTGCEILFRLYQAAPVVLASLVAIWFYEKEMRAGIRRLLIYSGAVLIVVIPFVIYYASLYPAAGYALFIDSVGHNHAMALNYFFRLKTDFADISRYANGYKAETHYSLNLFGLWLTALYHFIIYAIPLITVLLVAMSYEKIKKLNNFDKTIFIFFAAWAVLFFPYPFERGEANRVAHILPPYYFVLLFLLLRTSKETGTGYFYKCIIIMSISFLIVKNLLQVYFVHDFNSLPKYTIATEHGTYRLADKTLADNQSGLLSFIANNTLPGEYIFSTAWDGPPVYLLTGRRNPTYYDSMIDVVVRPTEQKQQRIINDLMAHHTRLVIIQPDLMYDGMPSRSYRANCKTLDTFIHTHYSLKKLFGDFEVYTLNE